MKIIDGGICAAKGFLTSGVAANIKRNGEKKDVAIIYSQTPAVAAGVFTNNKVKAAPVILSQQHLAHATCQAIVINSGNANACTGTKGAINAKLMCETTAKALNLPVENVLVASTGVIGVQLPIERVTAGIDAAAKSLSAKASVDAAAAIMTTDTFAKEIAVQINLHKTSIHIGGIAKGSGMICPNMATTLGFITTDAAIGKETLQLALKQAVAKSFNMITVDGDTSTNDMVIAIANGAANNPEIDLDSAEFVDFCKALEYVLIYLAKAVVRDGEGATKLIEMQVHGATSVNDAEKAALAVCNSPLVKTAIFGQDANWGRILCALGYSGADFDPHRVDLYLGDIAVMQQGAGIDFDETRATKILAEKEIVIKAHLNTGMASATAWGCDLSYDYVKINGSYRS